MGKIFKEMKQRSQKFGRQHLEKNFRNRNCRNEFTGGKLREGNCGREIAGGKLRM